jgi:hypothetical protein
MNEIKLSFVDRNAWFIKLHYLKIFMGVYLFDRVIIAVPEECISVF